MRYSLDMAVSFNLSIGRYRCAVARRRYAT